jgi:hypothetical protein
MYIYRERLQWFGHGGGICEREVDGSVGRFGGGPAEKEVRRALPSIFSYSLLYGILATTTQEGTVHL